MIGTYIKAAITFQMNDLMYFKNKDRLFSYLVIVLLFTVIL